MYSQLYYWSVSLSDNNLPSDTKNAQVNVYEDSRQYSCANIVIECYVFMFFHSWHTVASGL